MDSRQILTKDKIYILIDSKTYLKALETDPVAGKILTYDASPQLDFYRTELIIPDYNPLSKITEIKIEFDDLNVNKVMVPTDEGIVTNFLSYTNDMINITTQRVYEKDNVNEDELHNVLLSYIQGILNSNYSNVLLINDKALLQKRYSLEKRLNKILNIMTISEVKDYLNIYFKNREEYYTAPIFSCDRWMWYWHTMRLKLPYYNVGEKYIDSLVTRFNYCLMAVDFIGIEFFKGANNTTLEMSIYHFDHLIALITGIFDNFALKINESLTNKVTDRRKINLTNRDFLKIVRDENIIIRDYIMQHTDFIKLIYSFREIILHREGLDAKNALRNAIEIDPKIKMRLHHLKDQKLPYDDFSEWGYYDFSSRSLFIEPYHFAKKGTLYLTDFINEFFKIFGYSYYLEKERNGNQHLFSLMKSSKKWSLGI